MSDSSNPSPGDNTQATINENFSIDVDLNHDLLTPLSVKSHEDVKKGKPSSNKEHFTFGIKVSDNNLDSLNVTISNDKGEILHQNLGAKSKGQHEWKWDGFDNKGILNTKNLKSTPLKIVFDAKKGKNQQTNKPMSLLCMYLNTKKTGSISSLIKVPILPILNYE